MMQESVVLNYRSYAGAHTVDVPVMVVIAEGTLNKQTMQEASISGQLLYMFWEGISDSSNCPGVQSQFWFMALHTECIEKLKRLLSRHALIRN